MSAGGNLTGQAVAWFSGHGLPMPGAVGIFASSLSDYSGDSVAWNQIGGWQGPQTISRRATVGYFEGADQDDPMLHPMRSTAIMDNFPPTLFITGTRGIEMIAAAVSHAALLRHGRDSQHYVIENG